jgi:hypothetical protein
LTHIDQVEFLRVAPPRGTVPGVQIWDVIDPASGTAFARAEVFPGEIQWGVRLQDRAPALEDSDLLKLVARLLVWHVQCPADTVDVVLGRTRDHHALVKVGADYV